MPVLAGVTIEDMVAFPLLLRLSFRHFVLEGVVSRGEDMARHYWPRVKGYSRWLAFQNAAPADFPALMAYRCTADR